MNKYIRFSVRDMPNILPNLFDRPIPPSQLQQAVDCICIEPLTDLACRHSADDRISRNIFRHDSPCSDDRAVADMNAGQDDCLESDPDVVADDDVALIVPSRRDIGPIQSPLLVKERESIGGKRPQRVIGAVEQEFSAAGDRTELADNEPFAMDRIVIQHVISLEIARIVYEIVVNRIVADLDRRIADYRIQINRLHVLAAGIYFCCHYSINMPMQPCSRVTFLLFE